MMIVDVLVRFIIYWIVSFILSLYIHEFGHLIVGILHGWKLYLLVIGPIKLYRVAVNAPIKLGIETNITHWFGVAATLPTKQDSNMIHVFRKILIAGPISSMIFATMVLLCSFYFRSFFLLIFGLTSLALGIVNYIPLSIRTGFYYNDGTRYRRIKNGGIPAKEEAEIMNIVGKQVQYGENVRIVKEECLSLIASQDYIYRYYGYYVLYQSALKNDANLVNEYFTQVEALSHTVPKSVIKMFPLDYKAETL